DPRPRHHSPAANRQAQRAGRAAAAHVEELRPPRAPRSQGRPALPGDPRLPRPRPHHRRAAASVRAGRLAHLRLGQRPQHRRQGGHHRATARAAALAGGQRPRAGRRLEPGRRIRPRAGARSARTGAGGGDARLAFLRRPPLEQRLAAVRARRRPQGRRAARHAHPRQAAGADAGAMVAQGRAGRAARRLRPAARKRQGGGDRLQPHGFRGHRPRHPPGGRGDHPLSHRAGPGGSAL
ncbi:MAG: hypothetical protein AVDCRST_MAG31-1374, partial [uncultured Sphingomonas sp.]